MSEAAKDYVILGINVSPEERAEVHRLAKERGYKITSDYLRYLIEQDAKANGVEIKFDVNRGGDRRPD